MEQKGGRNVGQRSEKSRIALMNAAEELYAREGLGAVSNRRIAEHAGASNNSAVAYHFGNRDGLINAMLERHYRDLESYMSKHVAALPEKPSLWELIACRVLPMVELFDDMPAPSWRARFLGQVYRVPELREDLVKSVSMVNSLTVVQTKYMQEAKARSKEDEAVIQARSGILGHMVSGLCSEYEVRVEEGTQQGAWIDVGYFLVDAISGMLSAPVTRRKGQVLPTTGEPFI